MQNAAIDFVADIINLFGDDIRLLYFRNEDLCNPFEWYLQNGSIFDRSVFSTLEFEDDFGMGIPVEALEFWSKEINRTDCRQEKVIEKETFIIEKMSKDRLAYETYISLGINERSIFTKLIYWTIADKKFAAHRIKAYLKGKKNERM